MTGFFAAQRFDQESSLTALTVAPCGRAHPPPGATDPTASVAPEEALYAIPDGDLGGACCAQGSPSTVVGSPDTGSTVETVPLQRPAPFTSSTPHPGESPSQVPTRLT
jgi:hypothetical protein